MNGGIDRRLRSWVLAAAGVAVAGYAVFALAASGTALRFVGFSVFVHGGLVFLVLAALAAMQRWVDRDLSLCGPSRGPGVTATPPTPPGERRAA